MYYNKYIIFYTANYCQKIKSFFDVDHLITAGINVEYWDLSNITAHEKLSPVKTAGLCEITISTFADLKNNIKRVKGNNTLFLSFVNYAHYSYKVYAFLSYYKVDILYATSGVLPSLPANSFESKNPFRKYSFRTILRVAYLKMLLKLPLFKPARFVLMSCNKASCDYKTSGHTQYVSCNSGDYNRYVREQKEKQDRQIVFIDQYTPFHNDYTIRGIKHIPAKKYYNALNRFFSVMEEKYDCKVVVCAHPSALKYIETDFFEGRKVYYNDTSRQVNKSIGVIAQFSTAISFPVMDNKPILLVTTDDMNNYDPHCANFARYLSEILHIPMINIDHDADICFGTIDKNAYSAYLYNYLTTPKARYIYNSDVLLSIANNDIKHLIY